MNRSVRCINCNSDEFKILRLGSYNDINNIPDILYEKAIESNFKKEDHGN